MGGRRSREDRTAHGRAGPGAPSVEWVVVREDLAGQNRVGGPVFDLAHFGPLVIAHLPGAEPGGIPCRRYLLPAFQHDRVEYPFGLILRGLHYAVEGNRRATIGERPFTPAAGIVALDNVLQPPTLSLKVPAPAAKRVLCGRSGGANVGIRNPATDRLLVVIEPDVLGVVGEAQDGI